MGRKVVSVNARLLGRGAYVYTTANVEARRRPDLLSGVEVESVMRSRLCNGWFIELVHPRPGAGASRVADRPIRR